MRRMMDLSRPDLRNARRPGTDGPASTFHGYEEWKGWSAESFGVCDRAAALYYAAELRRAGLNPDARLRVLEIGFGNGTFAGWARSRGYDYTGTELIPALLERGARAGFRVVDGDIDRMLAELGSEGIDLVVAFDVIEHMELDAVGGLLDAIRTVLRPGGRFVARVPSGDSPFGRAAFHGDLTHRFAPGSSAVRQLAARHGFDVLEIGAPCLPVRGLGVRRALRRASVRIAQRLIGRVIDMAFHHNARLVMTSNLVFVLAKPSRAAGLPT